MSTRRRFLKIAGMAALGWGVRPGKFLAPAHAEGLIFASRHEVPRSEHGLHAARWAMVIDSGKMTQEIMHRCIATCHSLHNVPSIDSKQEIKWIWETHFEALFPNQNHKYLKDLGDKPFLSMCNHCDNPPCVRVCPTKATFQREDGIVMMDFHRCIGCRYCMAACPYGSRSFNFMDPRPYIREQTINFPTRTKGVVEKCEFCAERLAEGKIPACVEVSEGAMLFGDLEDPNSEVRKVLGARYSIRRSPGLGTEPCVYYLI